MVRSAGLAVVLAAASCGDDRAAVTASALALALDTEVRLLDLDGASQRWAEVRAYRVAWSPDSRWLAYITPREGGVLFIDDADTHERVFEVRADWTTSFAWAPGGDRLAFRTGDYRAGGVSVVEASTGDVRVLTPASGDDSDPVWSPDGRRLLFRRTVAAGEPAERSRIFVADLETGEVARVTDSVDALHESHASYTADGRWVVFISDGNLHALGPAGRRLRLGTAAPFGLAYVLPRPGSSEFVYAAHGEADSARMLLVDPDRGLEVELDRTDQHYFWWEDAVWSPDGRWIAFEVDRSDCSHRGTGLYLHDVDRGEKRLLATIPVTADIGAIRWSPGGDQLAVLASDCHVTVDQDDPRWGTRRSEVDVVTVDTGEVERVHVEPQVSAWDLAWR